MLKYYILRISQIFSAELSSIKEIKKKSQNVKNLTCLSTAAARLPLAWVVFKFSEDRFSLTASPQNGNIFVTFTCKFLSKRAKLKYSEQSSVKCKAAHIHIPYVTPSRKNY